MDKIDKKEYHRIHNWLRYHHGKASYCCHCNTKNCKRYEFALIKGKEYARDINNYIQLCSACHKAYDFKEETGEKISKGLKGLKRPYRWVTLYQHTKDGLFIAMYDSLESASKATGVMRTAIDNNLHDRSKSAGGFVWAKKILC
jgi:hypothetical protein